MANPALNADAGVREVLSCDHIDTSQSCAVELVRCVSDQPHQMYRIAASLFIASVVASCGPHDADHSQRYGSSLDSINVALVLFQQGDSARAIQKIERIIAHKPTYAEAMMLAGAMRERLGDKQTAFRWYTNAGRVLRQRVANPEDWKLPQEMNLALALFMAGDTLEATRLMEAQAQRKTSDSIAVRAWGSMIMAGDREEVLRALLPPSNT